MFTVTALSTILFALATSASPLKRADAFLLQAETNPEYCLGTTLTPGNDVGLSNVACTLANDPNSGFSGKFEIARGNNPNGIRLSGTNYCLDAGLPLDGTGLIKLYTCYPGTAQQTWYYTDDDHLALTGLTTCIDYAGQGCGRFNCSPGMKKCGVNSLPGPLIQKWNLLPVTGPTPGGNSGDGGGFAQQEIHFNGDNGKCLFTDPASNSLVRLFNCDTGSNGSNNKKFGINRGSGPIRAAGVGNLCLDSGTNPTDGTLARLQTCNGTPQQNFYYTGEGDDHIAITGGTLCLDVKREDGTSLQFWTCSNNPQQHFTL